MSQLEEFETFMMNYQNMVFTTAVRLLGNETDAADISQNAFLKAYEHFENIRTSPTAGGWMKTVTTNLCLNHLQRYRNRWRMFSDLRNEKEDEASFESDLAAEAPADVLGEDERSILEKALARLPEAQRVPLVLYHFEDLSYDEIAARLKVTIGKVKTDIHRGRDALKNKLKLDAEGEPVGLRVGS